METHSKKVGTTITYIRANWSQASCAISVRHSDCGEDAEWEATGTQVADFRHDPKLALEYFSRE
jgi:hypothetical protein